MVHTAAEGGTNIAGVQYLLLPPMLVKGALQWNRWSLALRVECVKARVCALVHVLPRLK